MAAACSWLEEALQSEREYLGFELERRHKNLLKRFVDVASGWNGLEYQLPVEGAASLGTTASNDANDANNAKEETADAEASTMSVLKSWEAEEIDQGNADPGDLEEQLMRNAEHEDRSAAVEAVQNTSSRSAKEAPVKGPFVVRRTSTKQFDLLTGPSGRLQAFVFSARFEVTFAIMILLNMLVLAFESQYHGLDLGYDLDIHNSESKASDAWPGASSVWPVLDMVFGFVFTIELMFRLFAQRRHFLRDLWNIFDLIVVCLWYISTFGTDALPLPPMILRMIRMGRLLRLLKLVRTVQEFDSLYLLTSSIKASFAATCWSMIFLGVLESMLAITLAFLLEPYMTDSSKPLARRQEVYEFFGTFTRSFLTMFELCLGNWIPATRLVAEHVSEWYLIIFLLHKLIVGFAVVRVISGVFLHETFKVAALDDAIMVRAQERTVTTHRKKIHALFVHADSSGDGLLDLEEFRAVMHDPDVHTWLAAMGLDISDADRAFKLVMGFTGKSKISANQLVQSTSRLKGNARAFDMAMLKEKMEELYDKVNYLCESGRPGMPQGFERNDWAATGRAARQARGASSSTLARTPSESLRARPGQRIQGD